MAAMHAGTRDLRSDDGEPRAVTPGPAPMMVPPPAGSGTEARGKREQPRGERSVAPAVTSDPRGRRHWTSSGHSARHSR
jgi:hypothetical protein